MMMNLLIVLLSAAFFVYTNGTGLGPNLPKLGAQGALQDGGKTMLDLMQKHFDLSLDYIYTGIQFDSQYGERPGLAKKLRGMSDAHWEAGMSALNKHLQHGGSTDQSFINSLNFGGKQRADLGITPKGEIYMRTLNSLSDDSNDLLALYNNIYRNAITNNADIAHYMEEKIEKEVEHHHELEGHKTTLNSMKGLGAAVAAFDSNL